MGFGSERANGLSYYTQNGVELVSGAPGNEIRALGRRYSGTDLGWNKCRA